MTSTRDILAQQAEASRIEQEEIAAGAAPVPPEASPMPPTTTMHSRADGRTHTERLNEFGTAVKETFDMLSPEQFDKLVTLLEPIAEVNILMLPLIRAQVSEFEAREARQAAYDADREAGADKPAEGGDAPSDVKIDPAAPVEPAPAPAPDAEPPPADKPAETV